MEKRILLSLVLVLNITLALAQQKVSDGTVSGTSLPNKDAIFELESSNKGLLYPRVTLKMTTDPYPLSAHVAGMLIYNTVTAGDAVPGVYYNDGTKWVSIQGGGSGGKGIGSIVTNHYTIRPFIAG